MTKELGSLYGKSARGEETNTYYKLIETKDHVSDTSTTTTTTISSSSSSNSCSRRRSSHTTTSTQHYDNEYIKKVKRLKEKKIFGDKTIGQTASYIYLINQIFGSGIVALPYIFKMSGWLPCLIINILICILTIFNTLLFLRSMTMIPNNIHFNKRYEYISTICYFLGKKNIYFWLLQICYYASILGSNIISIVIVSHAVDYIIINLFGSTVGLVLYPTINVTIITDINEFYYSKNYILYITLGYVINTVVSIYFSQSNLENNMKVQYLSFIFLMTTLFEMIILSAMKIYKYNYGNNNVDMSYVGMSMNKIVQVPPIQYPTIFGNYNFKQLLSSYISSYSTLTVIPCWVNEMKSDVKIIRTVWISNLFCCFLYFIFGYVLCTAYPNINNDNILNDILQYPFINIYMKISIYLFDLLTIAPGIYVYCIATRYNLINSNLCSENFACFFGTILPFILAFFFSSREIFETMFNWSSLIFAYVCNFITPAIIYLIACKNIPYSNKNPLHYMHVLYNPKEYKKEQPIYNLFYTNVTKNKENEHTTEHLNHSKQYEQPKQIEQLEQPNIRTINSNKTECNNKHAYIIPTINYPEVKKKQLCYEQISKKNTQNYLDNKLHNQL
ncbi:amino acid transporter, putative, partial [Hepatocystis sp. ex Piliocolobus tephrosceles]